MSMNKIFFYAIGLMMVFSLSAGQALAEGGAMKSGDTYKSDQKAGAATGTKAMDTMGSHRGSELMNKNVKNDKGDNLGKIKDFVFDRDGELSYIVISSAAAAGDKMIPIPFSSDMMKFQGDSVVVSNLDKTMLDKAPTISSSEWNKLDDPTFESRVHGYFRQGAAGGAAGAAGQEHLKKTEPGATGATGDQKKY